MLYILIFLLKYKYNITNKIYIIFYNQIKFTFNIILNLYLLRKQIIK